jgi:hypothetical protein
MPVSDDVRLVRDADRQRADDEEKLHAVFGRPAELPPQARRDVQGKLRVHQHNGQRRPATQRIEPIEAARRSTIVSHQHAP